MTFVGKILVIAIMAFSLLFLGISTVAFTTAKNWMAATQAEQKKVDESQEESARRPGGLGSVQEGPRRCESRVCRRGPDA